MDESKKEIATEICGLANGSDIVKRVIIFGSAATKNCSMDSDLDVCFDKENLRAKSLRAFCKKYAPGIAIRTSLSDYRKEDWMTNVPLYLLSGYIDQID